MSHYPRRIRRQLLVYALWIFTCSAILFQTGCHPTTEKELIRGPGTVTHVVVCWLKSPGDRQAIAELTEATKSFTEIPGILEIATGTALSSPRPVVVTDFDIAIVITFRDEQALRDYEKHPIHQRAANEILKPLAKKVMIFDFVQNQS